MTIQELIEALQKIEDKTLNAKIALWSDNKNYPVYIDIELDSNNSLGNQAWHEQRINITLPCIYKIIEKKIK